MRRYSNDVTTLSFNDLVKNEEKEKNKYNRLESNIYLNKRESYDDSNKLINSLNEELLSLKRKMKFVYEKDEEIQKLKNKVNELQSNNINSQDKCQTENITLRFSLSSLEEKNKEYLNRIDELIMKEKQENHDYEEYKRENDKLKKDNSLLKRELNLLKKKKSVDDITDIDFDVEVKVKEKVKIDIQKLKKILSKKLENKRDNQVEGLLKKYNIIDQKEIDKDIIEKLIRKII